jgi:hypothetical protein
MRNQCFIAVRYPGTRRMNLIRSLILSISFPVRAHPRSKWLDVTHRFVRGPQASGLERFREQRYRMAQSPSHSGWADMFVPVGDMEWAPRRVGRSAAKTEGEQHVSQGYNPLSIAFKKKKLLPEGDWAGMVNCPCVAFVPQAMQGMLLPWRGSHGCAMRSPPGRSMVGPVGLEPTTKRL